MWSYELFLALTIGVAALPVHARAQGALDDIRNDVRRPTQPTSGPSAHEPQEEEENATDALLGDMFGELFGPIVIFPFALGAQQLAEAQPLPLLFLDSPYQGGYPGFLAADLRGSKYQAERWQERITQRTWFGRLTLDEGYDFFDNVNRASGSLLLDSTARLGLQTNWSVFSERRSNGGSDTLAVGNMNVTHRYFESRRIMMRIGLGANTLVDRHGSDWGFNFHLDSDWFLKRPFVISSAFDAGSLGSAMLLHLRGTVGVVRQRYELLAGYDWLHIGSSAIHGPMVGLRLWF